VIGLPALPGWWKFAAGGLLVAAIVTGAGWFHVRAVDRAVAAERDRLTVLHDKALQAAQDDAAARLADQRAQSNRALLNYAAAQAQAETMMRNRQNELRKATAALAACRLGDPVVRLLNSSRSDATGDNRSAIPGPGPALPSP
jgi:hypothetical protein